MALGPFTKQEHLEIATLGLELAAAETLGVLGGWWLDKHFNTLPWWTLAGGAVGFAAGMYMVVTGAQKAQAAAADKLNHKKAEK